MRAMAHCGQAHNIQEKTARASMSGQMSRFDSLLAQLDRLWDLEPAAMMAVKDEIDTVALHSGSILFRQGDASDSIYVLLTGRLDVVIGKPEGGRQRIGEIRAGETVGELGMITRQPRSATIIATRDSELVQLRLSTFENLMKKRPATLLRLTQAIARRMGNVVGGIIPPKLPTTQAIIALEPDLPLDEICKQVRLGVEASRGRVGVLDESHEGQPSEHFFAEEQRHARLIYRSGDPRTTWTELCLRQSDVALLIARPTSPVLAPSLINNLKQTIDNRRCHLIVLRDREQRNQPAANWLDEVPFDVRWNIDLGHADEIARLRRIAAQQTRGMVLAGGGSRGFAHLGIIKALYEADIAIDHVGGTSMGAIIAAGIASGLEIDEFQDRLRRVFLARNPLGDYTLPLHAIARGHRLSTLLQESFGSRRIQDLAIPFYCTSTNLTQGGPQTHSRGPVWRALRASVSIPGLVPPIVEDEQVLVDGGLVNNFPIDIMRLRNSGPLLGSDVGDYRDDFWLDEKRISQGVWSMARHRHAPTVPDVLIRSMTVAGAATSRRQEGLADFVVRPPVEGVGLLNWNRLDDIVAQSYRFAVDNDIAAQVQAVIDAQSGVESPIEASSNANPLVFSNN